MSKRPIAQPKKGTCSSSFLNTNAKGRGIKAGIKNVSKVDWCLTNNIAGLVPWGRFSIPVTFTRIPKMTRAPAIDHVNHCDAIHHNGLPRTKIEATKIAIAHGMTVMNIQSMCNTERKKEMKVCIRLTTRDDKVCECTEVGVHDGFVWIA